MANEWNELLPRLRTAEAEIDKIQSQLSLLIKLMVALLAITIPLVITVCAAIITAIFKQLESPWF